MKKFSCLFLFVLALACILARGQTGLDELRARAEKGDLSAQLKLARAYFQGAGVPKDQAEALRWFRKAADQGEPQSQRILGIFYDMGAGGVAKDESQAAFWYRKAADQGDALAQSRLGRMYETGAGGLPKDANQALIWYRKAADQGNATAQDNLGQMYENGAAVHKDESEALGWYRKAADQGDASALHHAAQLCINSRNSEVRDPDAGLNYARLAVKAGGNNPAFLNTLAQAYYLEGQFEDAVRTQQQALASVLPDHKAEYEQALSEYQRALAKSKENGARPTWKLPD